MELSLHLELYELVQDSLSSFKFFGVYLLKLLLLFSLGAGDYSNNFFSFLMSNIITLSESSCLLSSFVATVGKCKKDSD